jgi:hypothetical protein
MDCKGRFGPEHETPQSGMIIEETGKSRWIREATAIECNVNGNFSEVGKMTKAVAKSTLASDEIMSDRSEWLRRLMNGTKLSATSAL